MCSWYPKNYLSFFIAMFVGTFVGIYMAVVLAAIMSTVDSLLVLASSTIVRDIYQKIINPKTHIKDLIGRFFLR